MKIEHMDDLMKDQDLMNKIMKKYIDQVRSDPNLYIRQKSGADRILQQNP